MRSNTRENYQISRAQPLGLPKVAAATSATSLSLPERRKIPAGSGSGGHNPVGGIMLLYDASAGIGAFYSADANGGLRLIKQYDNFRKTWDIAVNVKFLPSGGGLFLYDRSAGTGAFYSVDPKNQ